MAVAIAAISSIALGALLGLVWARLAPRVDLIVAGDGKPYPEGYQPEGYMTDDGIAAILCAIAGLVVGACVVFAVRRAARGQDLDRGMRWAAVLVVILGLLGAASLWLVGTRAASVDFDALLAASQAGDAVRAPLRLRMPGVLVLWPAASALIVFAVAVGDWLVARSRERQSAPGERLSGA